MEKEEAVYNLTNEEIHTIIVENKIESIGDAVKYFALNYNERYRKPDVINEAKLILAQGKTV